MARRDLIVIGASAGGVPALIELLQRVPADLPASVVVVVHTSPTSPGVLPRILDRASQLPVERASSGHKLQHSRVYVAPPDHHLLIQDSQLKLARGPRENGFRPAIDPLFRSAARNYGQRVIGVVLSGGMDDGTQGLQLIKRRGGVAIVQDPAEALFSSMPLSAIQNVEVDRILPAAEISAALVDLINSSVQGEPAMSGGNGNAQDVAQSGDNSLKTHDISGPPSALTCPECGGALWEIVDGKLLQYRCHIGHVYTEQGLEAAEAERLEEAMWSALRVLEENAELHRRLERRAKSNGLQGVASAHRSRVENIEERAELIRRVLLENGDRATLDLQQPLASTGGSSRSKKRSKSGKPMDRAMQVSPPRGKARSRKSRSKKKLRS